MSRHDPPSTAASASSGAAVLSAHVSNPAEITRYHRALEKLARLRPHLGGRVLDFGASYGLSMLALAEHGVTDTWGVEPDADRVRLGRRILPHAKLKADRLRHVPDTRALPFPDEHFDTVLALAVIEHIPQPRGEYIREMWRVLRAGGRLVIAETPNRYFPVDVHTTGLPLVPWLPSRIAHALGRRWGRTPEWYRDPEKWKVSGWRGLGYRELLSAIDGPREVIHETTRMRHRVLRALRLPSGLIDPYPVHVLRKGMA